MESWRLKIDPWRPRVCRIMIADSHNFNEKLDPDPGPLESEEPDPDPHSSYKLDPDPEQH
jgi:hypothetical protein